MFNANLHFNFLRCLFLVNFSLYTYSSKTFQVHRFNETSYIVTTVPDMDDPYNIVLDDNVFGKTDTGKRVGNSDYDCAGCIINTIKVGDVPAKRKTKVSIAFINKARENYFRKYYGTTKKPTLSSLLPDKVLPYMQYFDSTASSQQSYENSFSNLEMARKLAYVLMAEVQTKTEERLNVDKHKRNKRFKKTSRVKIKNR